MRAKRVRAAALRLGPNAWRWWNLRGWQGPFEARVLLEFDYAPKSWRPNQKIRCNSCLGPTRITITSACMAAMARWWPFLHSAASH